MTGQRNAVAALHARTPGFAARVDRARAIVAQALALEKACAPYVAFSAGKDSTVVLHLVREQAPDAPAVFADDEWNLPETLDLVARTPGCARIASRVWHADWFTSWESGEDIPAGTVWVDAPRRDGLQTYGRGQGYDLAFIGLRREESAHRRIHLRKYGPLYFAASDDFWHCNPIHDWSWRDVWAYIVSRQLDYNRAYDVLEALGVPPEHQRIGPLAVERVLGYGQLVILKRGWPELFNRFAAAHPEARSYV